jgi:hypothetical protein
MLLVAPPMAPMVFSTGGAGGAGGVTGPVGIEGGAGRLSMSPALLVRPALPLVGGEVGIDARQRRGQFAHIGAVLAGLLPGCTLPSSMAVTRSPNCCCHR